MVAAGTPPSEGRNYTAFPVWCQAEYVIESSRRKPERNSHTQFALWIGMYLHGYPQLFMTDKSFWWPIMLSSSPSSKTYGWVSGTGRQADRRCTVVYSVRHGVRHSVGHSVRHSVGHSVQYSVRYRRHCLVSTTAWKTTLRAIILYLRPGIP